MYGKLAWEKYNDEQINDIMTFNEGYKNYITKGKTERLCVSETVKLAMAHGYKELNEVDILKPGDKVYVTNIKKYCFICYWEKTARRWNANLRCSY